MNVTTALNILGFLLLLWACMALMKIKFKKGKRHNIFQACLGLTLLVLSVIPEIVKRKYGL